MALTMIPLHVHSQYTLLGATPTVEALAQRAAAQGLSHLALTDTHALYGAVAFDRACRAVGVQALIGLTLNVAWPADLPPLPAALPGQVVLLARDPAGYRSLCRLSSLVQGHADRETRAAQGLALADLRTHAAGLLALDAGQAVTLVGARLPGWSRESGYLWDGATWLLVKWEPGVPPPPVWQPVVVRGRWQQDRWEMAWVQASGVIRVSASNS